MTRDQAPCGVTSRVRPCSSPARPVCSTHSWMTPPLSHIVAAALLLQFLQYLHMLHSQSWVYMHNKCVSVDTDNNWYNKVTVKNFLNQIWCYFPEASTHYQSEFTTDRRLTAAGMRSKAARPPAWCSGDKHSKYHWSLRLSLGEEQLTLSFQMQRGVL